MSGKKLVLVINSGRLVVQYSYNVTAVCSDSTGTLNSFILGSYPASLPLRNVGGSTLVPARASNNAPKDT